MTHLIFWFFLFPPPPQEVIYSSYGIQATLNCNIYNPVSITRNSTKCTVSLIINVNVALIFDRLTTYLKLMIIIKYCFEQECPIVKVFSLFLEVYLLQCLIFIIIIGISIIQTALFYGPQ
jgi:hypothetical protein